MPFYSLAFSVLVLVSVFSTRLIAQSIVVTSQTVKTILIGQRTVSSTIDDKDNPIFRCRIKAETKSTSGALSPIVQTISNVTVREGVYAIQPFEVVAVANGFYDVRWIAYSRGKPSDSTYRVTLLVCSDGLCGTADVNVLGLPGFVKFSARRQAESGNFEQAEVFEWDFGTLQAGSDSTKTISFEVINGKLRTPFTNEETLRIDSITTKSPIFKALWWGSIIETKPRKQPPLNAIPGYTYYLDVTFSPPDAKFYEDEMTVYYENGAKVTLRLYGNFNPPFVKPTLQLVSPNGSEKFAPCQVVPVKWSGSILGYPVRVEFSTDDGNSWRFAGESRDSIFYWYVPDIESSKCRIRVLQSIDPSDALFPASHSSAAQRIAFNDRGTSFLIGHAGKVFEQWDRVSLVRQAQFQQTSTLGADQKVTGAGFNPTSNEWIVTCKSPSGSDKSSYIGFLKFGDETQARFVKMRAGIDDARESVIDPKGRFIAVIPELSNVISLYSQTDGSFQSAITFERPVASFSQFGDSGVVALYGGKILLVQLPTFTILRTETVEGIPIISKILLFEDGQGRRRLALAPFAEPATLTTKRGSEVHVVDLDTWTFLGTQREDLECVGLTSSLSGQFLAYMMEGSKLIQWDYATKYKIRTDFTSSDLSSHALYAPDAKQIVVTNKGVSRNVIVKNTAFPELDGSDLTFSIITPKTRTVSVSFPELPVFVSRDTLVTAVLCNSGDVPVHIENPRFKYGSFYRLLSNFVPTTLGPNECINVEIEVTVGDTGMLYDSLLFSTCSRTWAIPLSIRGLKRKLALLSNNLDFGSACLGEKVERRIDIVRNDDNVPLLVNRLDIPDISNSSYRMLDQIKDTILQASQTLSARVEFSPKKLGANAKKIGILYENQTRFQEEFTLTGTGIGADILNSHSTLLFIPEIKTRTITITSNSDNAVTIDSIIVRPAGIFTINQALPILLQPKGSTTLTVEWNGDSTADVSFVVVANPCNVHYSWVIGRYTSRGSITIPTVAADVHGFADIPINFQLSSSGSYKGERFFVAEFSVNPRMFLPTEATSVFGSATITRNEIVGEKRIVGVRVVGDFENSGTVATVRGYAGLAEDSVSTLEFLTGSGFGISSSLTYGNGLLKLTGLFGNRRILQPGISLVSISPNPTADEVSVVINSDVEKPILLGIYNSTGTLLNSIDCGVIDGRSETIRFSVADLSMGVYRVGIVGLPSVSLPLMIIR